MYKPFSYFFFFIWQFPLLLFAQPRNDNLVLYSLTEQNGLSDNQVNCFFQDSKGFIWIGTQDGLNRYDGSVIKTFKKRNADTTQLLDNRIMAIKEDRAGHIWIVSPSGLNEYDPKNNIFHSYQTEINKNGVYLMNDICFDVSGNMWIASSSGLFEFLPSQKKFKLFINQKGKNFKADNRFTKITIDDKGRICIAGYSGLWQFLPKAEVFQLATTDPADASLINEMLKDHNNKLWLGYWNGGLKFFDPDTKNIFDIDKKNLPVNIFGIAETKNANGDYSIWCDGLYEYKPAEQKTIKHSQPATELNTDFSNSALYFSQDGLLWIGTDKGVRIMDPNKQFFSHHFLSDKQITSQGIAVLQKENMLYVGGAEQNFLKAYDSNFKLIKIVLPPVQIREPGLFTRPAILNLVQEDADHTWLCTERGLVLLNDKTKQTRVFLLTEKDILTPTRNFISNIFIDSRGNHWVFPWRSGIWQIDVKTGQFKKMISGLMQENNEIKKFLISAAAEDINGNIWFSDLDEGIIFYNRNTGQFSKPLEKIFGARYSIQNIEAEKNYVWGVKTGAVFRINILTNQMKQWPVPDDFNKNVTGFCSDKYDHIWITTTSGLISFNKTSHSFKRYTSNDGLLDNVMQGTIYSLHNGKIIYASDNYITEFDPKEMMKGDKPPPVVITNILSQNKPVSIQENNDHKKIVDLNYTYNNFSFSWAILNYSNPLQNRFYCKLEGVDKDWKFVGYSGQAQYASLAPGKYIFRVRGATGEGVMNEQGDAVEIIIHPPFWKQGWFITIASVVLLTAFVAIVRYISQRNLKEKLLQLEKEQAVEKERNRISRDMHDDLGSGLTKIAILSEVVKKQIHEPEKAKQQLENISESSRELVDNLQDIIWVLNPKNDTLESLAAYIREYALKFFEPLKAEVKFCFPEKFPEVKLSEETRRNIFLVVKESFNNIAKHAWCNQVSIGVVVIDHIVKLSIKDDGKGFDLKNVRFFGNGLINMKNRMKQVGGSYHIISEPGRGTETNIEIPV